MNEHPILFSGPEVRAILDGHKTQTRRVCTVPWHKGKRAQPYAPHYWVDDGKLWFDDNPACEIHCPYGVPGDRLWVRETWADLRGLGFGRPFAYLADSLTQSGREDLDVKRIRMEYGVKWRPSIHMPRCASRLTLEVTGVRIERLQAISEADAIAEVVAQYTEGNALDPRALALGIGGVLQSMKTSTRRDFLKTALAAAIGVAACGDPKVALPKQWSPDTATATQLFGTLWESIYGKSAPWASNPWVWVVEFKRVAA